MSVAHFHCDYGLFVTAIRGLEKNNSNNVIQPPLPQHRQTQQKAYSLTQYVCSGIFLLDATQIISGRSEFVLCVFVEEL